jgi:hypothetical protein
LNRIAYRILLPESSVWRGETTSSFGGRLITPRALRELDDEDRLLGLCRHQRGDWGNLDEEDRESNEQALVEGSRLLSCYTARNGRRFWIITEWDRSATTILLPEEY